MRSYQRHEQDAFYFVHDTKLGLQRNHLHFQNHLGCSEVQDLHLSLLAPSLTLCPIYPQGKFIRIHFGATGKLASADIETCEYAGSLAPSSRVLHLCLHSPLGAIFCGHFPSVSCLCLHLPLDFIILFPLNRVFPCLSPLAMRAFLP